MTTREILTIIESMDKSIDEPIVSGRLVQKHDISERHFRRRFQRFTGELPKEYLRRLRLERAAHLLIFTEQNAAELATNCGFDSREGFVRAFTRHMKTTPETYRESWTRKMNRQLARVGRYFERNPMDIRLADSPARRVAYLRSYGGVVTILRNWWRICKWVKQSPALRHQSPVDVSYDTSGITSNSRLRCDVGIELPGGVDPGSNFGVRTIAPSRYVIARYSGPGLKVEWAWEWLIFHWMRANNLSPSTYYGVGVYADPLPTRWIDLLKKMRCITVDLYVPVRIGALLHVPMSSS